MDALKPPKEPKSIKRLRKKLQPNRDHLDDLKTIVRQHRNVTRMSVAIGHMARTEVVDRDTGELIKRDIPPEVAAKLQEVSTGLSLEAQAMKRKMTRLLRGVPIWDHFLKDVSGCGPVLAAYLVTYVDIHKAVKPSALLRFCGQAVINGRMERLTKGEKRHYHPDIRTQLYMMFTSIWKNAARSEKVASSKYFRIWLEAKHRCLHKEGVVKRENGKHERRLEGGKVVPWDGHSHTYGRNKAADVFLEDLYVMWRTLDGLPVWPSYYAAKLGYEHGGKISVNAPTMLDLDAALKLVA